MTHHPSPTAQTPPKQLMEPQPSQHTESSLVLVTRETQTITKETDGETKKSTWRRIKTHLRLTKRSSRQIEDKRTLESAAKPRPKEKRVSFLRAFLDAACPPLPPPPAPVPEPFVQMPVAYTRKDHRGVLVAGKRVPYSIHMHVGRKSELNTLESIAEEC